jgi:N-acetylneuraminate synthase
LKFRRSVTLVRAKKAGEEILSDDIAFKRPGTGISADRYQEVIGRRVKHAIGADKTLFWEDLLK